ncbi:MAG: VRR-NUC domain-containing protein [Bacteroidota bacterium]
MAKRINLEEQIQIGFFEYVGWRYPKIAPFIFHVPNGGTRHICEAKKLKKMGVRRGIWDVFVNIPSHRFNGLWIEFKANHNKLTKEQFIFLESIKKNNQEWAICYSLEEAIKVLDSYFFQKVRTLNSYEGMLRDLEKENDNDRCNTA